mmetsp:Transcript_26993/g.80423  ORF Transcript_26993/g.80423 Transcript_26993/m.80423 type:complete len:269 (+) Transcript_26993:781-1587(+)
MASFTEAAALSGLFCCRCRAAIASTVRGCTRRSSGSCVSASTARSIRCCCACSWARANSTSSLPGLSVRNACRASSHPFAFFSLKVTAPWTTATRGLPGKESRRRWSSFLASSSLWACKSNKHLLMAISSDCFLVSLCSKDSFEATLIRFRESERDLPSLRRETTLLQATANTVTSISPPLPERCLSTLLYRSVASSVDPRRWSTSACCTLMAASSSWSSRSPASSSASSSACTSSATQSSLAFCSRSSASVRRPSSIRAQARLKQSS